MTRGGRGPHNPGTTARPTGGTRCTTGCTFRYRNRGSDGLVPVHRVSYPPDLVPSGSRTLPRGHRSCQHPDPGGILSRDAHDRSGEPFRTHRKDVSTHFRGTHTRDVGRVGVGVEGAGEPL